VSERGFIEKNRARLPNAHERLTEHTFKLSAGKQSPAATIADMAWLAGHWTGEGLGGLIEEVWSPPRNGVMMGMFRLVRDGKPIFYELLTLAEERGSLTLRLKRFNADLTGWEEKDKTIDFPFIIDLTSRNVRPWAGGSRAGRVESIRSAATRAGV
jgi:hypothetical protein